MMRDHIKRWLSAEWKNGWSLGKLGAIVALLIIGSLTQACHHNLGPDLGGGDVGGGVVPQPSGPMAIDVRIVADPQGGEYVSELSCAIEVTEIPGSGSNPVVVYLNWVAPCGTHGSDAFLFEGGQQVYESNYAEGGNTIGMTFWAAISWTDAQGSHQIQSNMAVCR